MITHAWLLAAATILKRQKQASSRQCDRVVKAMDQNSTGLCAKELESPHCRRARPGATARHSSAAGCSPARAGSQRSSHTATARQRGPAWTRLTPIARATAAAPPRPVRRREGRRGGKDPSGGNGLGSADLLWRNASRRRRVGSVKKKLVCNIETGETLFEHLWSSGYDVSLTR